MSEFKKIKTCVNCRHLEIIEDGTEVVNEDGTAFISFRCEVFSYSGREVFRRSDSERGIVIEKMECDECPFWEEWVKDSETSEEETGLGAKRMPEPDDY